MRRQALNQALAEVSLFIARYPYFSFFVFASAVLMIITMALSFGGLSYRWEKRFASMLLFCIIPVCVGLIYNFYPFFAPLSATILLWLIFPIVFLIKRIKKIKQKKSRIAKTKGWVCKNCKEINEGVFLICKNCNLPRRDKK
jgi:hypothetical protein